ncbi:MAG: hypothetical protein AAGE76_11100 [Pseudomonadota bacterium]
MLVKIVTFFLIGMAILAMLGRLRMPKIGQRRAHRIKTAKKCPACGGYKIGAGSCSCGNGT